MQNMTETFDKKEEMAEKAETEKTGEEVKDKANHKSYSCGGGTNTRINIGACAE